MYVQFIQAVQFVQCYVSCIISMCDDQSKTSLELIYFLHTWPPSRVACYVYWFILSECLPCLLLGLVTADVRLCDVGDTRHSCARCRMTDDTKLPGNIVRTPATTNDPSCLIATLASFSTRTSHSLPTFPLPSVRQQFFWNQSNFMGKSVFSSLIWGSSLFDMRPPLLPAIYCARRIACELWVC